VGAVAATSRARRRRIDWSGWALLVPALLLLAVAFAAPLVAFLRYSFYTFRGGRLYELYTLDAYWRFLTQPYYHGIVLQTLEMAVLTMVLGVVLGYPLAYALWRLRRPGLKVALAAIVFTPLVVSAVVRSYGWQVTLSDSGPVNGLLMRLHVVASPLPLVFNMAGVVIAMVHIFLPFVVFPVYGSLHRIDESLRDASFDLGGGWWTTFRRVTLPLSLPGAVTGAQLSFTLALGAFVTPSMLGGGRVLVLPVTVFNDTSFINWPSAGVGGLALLVLALLAVWLGGRLVRWRSVET
jgi:putative spermidine/putrescine transport system permease protein